jgi:inner membrane protein involved in colicin E2 resistance
MTNTKRLIAIAVIFLVALIAWTILGQITSHRTNSSATRLQGDVESLWGMPQSQTASGLSFHWIQERLVKRQEEQNGKTVTVTEWVKDNFEKPVDLHSSNVAVDLRLNQRLRGLIWYPLYAVSFDGTWVYRHMDDKTGELRVRFPFPARDALYDDFQFVVDGKDMAQGLKPVDGVVDMRVPVAPDQAITLRVHYKSRGMRQWQYEPQERGVASLHDFHLTMSCDFAAIDFPQGSLSPSDKVHDAKGWKLRWDFNQVLTGKAMGLVMPERVQPGELAVALSHSAPVSLFFFFLVILALAMLRGLDIHPVNYMAIAGAFFSFQLLFAYLVDHVSIGVAFAIASLASIIMVTMYLRLVVGPRFAFREAAAAQLVYQVGFAGAHFLDGYTGLTVAVLATVTLFVLMMLTGRVKWSQALAWKASARSAT